MEFDGYSDACCSTDEMKFIDSLDSFMAKKSRVPKAVIRCHNIRIEFIRKFGPLFNTKEEMLNEMEHHNMVTYYPKLVAESIGPKGSKVHTASILSSYPTPIRSKI